MASLPNSDLSCGMNDPDHWRSLMKDDTILQKNVSRSLHRKIERENQFSSGQGSELEVPFRENKSTN
eukprot:4928983-Ditylum_brightwellii.AAC.1